MRLPALLRIPGAGRVLEDSQDRRAERKTEAADQAGFEPAGGEQERGEPRGPFKVAGAGSGQHPPGDKRGKEKEHVDVAGPANPPTGQRKLFTEPGERETARAVDEAVVGAVEHRHCRDAHDEASAVTSDAAHFAGGVTRAGDVGVIENVEGRNDVEGAGAEGECLNGGANYRDTALAGGAQRDGVGIDPDNRAVTAQPGGGATGAASGVQDPDGTGRQTPESPNKSGDLGPRGAVPPVGRFDAPQLLVGLGFHWSERYPSCPGDARTRASRRRAGSGDSHAGLEPDPATGGEQSELYDLYKDQGETTNLIVGNAAVVQELIEQYGSIYYGDLWPDQNVTAVRAPGNWRSRTAERGQDHAGAPGHV